MKIKAFEADRKTTDRRIQNQRVKIDVTVENLLTGFGAGQNFHLVKNGILASQHFQRDAVIFDENLALPAAPRPAADQIEGMAGSGAGLCDGFAGV